MRPSSGNAKLFVGIVERCRRLAAVAVVVVHLDLPITRLLYADYAFVHAGIGVHDPIADFQGAGGGRSMNYPTQADAAMDGVSEGKLCLPSG